MKKSESIFVAGHKGLVGSSVLSILKKKGFKKIITISRKKLDLRNYTKVEKFFKNKKIDYMVMAAARAGGILANNNNQMDFFFRKYRNSKFFIKTSFKKKNKKNNLSWYVLYLSKIFKNSYNRRKFTDWKIRKNKPMLCNCKNSRY